MAQCRNERLQRIGWRLGSLSSTPVDLLPPVLVLKDFIVELQVDIRDEALDLMGKGNYNTAVMYLNHGINISGLLRRDGSTCFTTADAKLLTLRSQCANQLGYSRAAMQDAEDALSINGYSISARVELVKARYAFACAEGEQSLTEFEDFVLHQTPKVKESPEVKDIIRQLGAHSDNTPLVTAPDRATTVNSAPVAANTPVPNWTPFQTDQTATNNQETENRSCRPKEKKEINQVLGDRQPVSQERDVSTSLSPSPSLPSQPPRQQKPAQASSQQSPPQTFSPSSSPPSSTVSKSVSKSSSPSSPSSTLPHQVSSLSSTFPPSTVPPPAQQPSLPSPPSSLPPKPPSSLQTLSSVPRSSSSPPSSASPSSPSSQSPGLKPDAKLNNEKSTSVSTKESGLASPEVAGNELGSGCRGEFDAFTLVTKKKTTPLSAKPGKTSDAPLPAVNFSNIPNFHLHLRYICGVCFASNKEEIVGKRGGSDPEAVCAGKASHDWQKGKIAVMHSREKSAWCKVKPRHPKLAREIYPRVCRSGDTCTRSKCMFPHIKEEVHLWHYMAKYNINTLADVLSIKQQTPKGAKRKSPVTITSGSSPPMQTASTLQNKGRTSTIYTVSLRREAPKGSERKTPVTPSPASKSPTTKQTLRQGKNPCTGTVPATLNTAEVTERKSSFISCASKSSIAKRTASSHQHKGSTSTTDAMSISHQSSKGTKRKSSVASSTASESSTIAPTIPPERQRKTSLSETEHEAAAVSETKMPVASSSASKSSTSKQIQFKHLQGGTSASDTKPERRELPDVTKRNSASSSPSSPVASTSHQPQKEENACTAAASHADPLAISSFKHPIKYICGICFARHGGSEVVEQRTGSKTQVCAGSGSHAWKQCKMVAMYSDSKKRWCKVNPRHHKLRPKVYPLLCIRGEACPRSDCMFPHIEEEVDLWVYMADHSMKTLAEVISTGKELSEGTETESIACRPSTSGQSSPADEDHHGCSYCNKSFPASWQLQQHIQTKDHWSKVNLDKDKKDQWKERSPPWNVVDGQYRECQEHKTESCMFTDALENNCTKAHSPEELEEWKERHRYRMMKMKKAKEKKLYAFMDEVLEKYNCSTGGEDVIADELPGIRVKCSDDLAQFLVAERKDRDAVYTYTWTFTVKASDSKSLKRVCLFYDDNRLRFRLSQPANESKAQVCPGNRIVEADGRTYRIDVIFYSKILGSFSQWVLFDLGTEPYLVRKLQVRVGSTTHHEIFHEMQKEKETQQNVVTWTSSNSEIVRFSDDDYQLSTSEEELLADYEVPSSLGIDDLEELSQDNYREYMHRMLYLEEHECVNKISKFATETKLKCMDTISIETSTGTVTNYSLGGSKYGSVDLKKTVMDDSETSQIIARSVRKMMLKFCNSPKIYEATILQDQNELGQHSQDTFYVKLSAMCVSDLKLLDATEYQVEIQLQLDRLRFCYMHSAIDHLKNMDMVFPPKDKPQEFPALNRKVTGQRINPHQDQIVSFISGHGRHRPRQILGVGPVLILGPFGTGKTHTLATAVERTLQTRPKSKILICTHSNSAADLYITEHLHSLVEKGSIRKMIRVYAKYRNIKTINETVRHYIPIQDYKIQIPTTEEIKACSVVITTLATSHRLETSQFRGHFTHILIDEAGQALETEVLQPLTFATGNTCVVLAGDHLQMNPKVFSRTARQTKFHISLIERLFYRKVGRVLLSSNYRTCQKMLDFISKAFYFGTCTRQQLETDASHEANYPLLFFTVKGEDQKIGMSYVNNYEVCQVALIAKDVRDTWPEEKWGKLDKNSIAIVTPYKIQIRQIRNELRKLRLGQITVETAENVQGKQFRVLIISTVRTRSTLNKVDTSAYVSTICPVNRPDDIFDYGFLSDPRLLNMACTRAQSLLIVVGDPMVLCSVGDCSKVWRKYLTECEENGTLFPLGTTVAGIQQEMEATKQRLNPYAAVFKPGESLTSTPFPTVNEADKVSEILEAPLSTEVDSWIPEEDNTIPDGILQELDRQIREDRRMLEDTGELPEMTDDVHDHERKESAKSKRKSRKYRMIEKNDQIILAFNYDDRSKRVGSSKGGDDTNFEEGLKNDMHNETIRKRAYEQVKEQPDRYKICSFHCEKSGQTYALPLDEDSSGRISITSKRRRGRALNLDEVIVEILDDMDESDHAEGEKKKYYGKVISICKRAARSALMSEIVCKLDENINNLMVPIDRTLPKLYVWSQNQDKRDMKNANCDSPDFSNVSIYRYRDSEEQMPFHHNVKVSRKDRQHRLFIVRYQKWLADLPYPIGAVTEELPQGDNKENGLRILKLMHAVKDEWKPDIFKKVKQQFPRDWHIPEKELESRFDARNQTAFTIDPPDCTSYDDALSVELVNDKFQVGIHIADVSYFVSKDTPVDKEAKMRATSFYPSFDKPVNMLPERFSSELCSLLPDQDRLAISVFVTFGRDSSLVGDVKLVRSVIRSRKQLTYEDAEKIISSTSNDGNRNDSIEEKILTLSSLANGRRKLRLGVGCYAFSHDAEEEEVKHPLAHSLVEEMMLIANQAVATFLVKKYPDCSPLRRQLAPSDDNVKDWLGKHSRDLTNSLELLSKPLLSEGLGEAPRDIKILKEIWDQLRLAAATDEARDQMTRITDLITSDENHPQLAAAKVNYFLIQEIANYISSGDHPDDSKRCHHTLKMAAYTHFTSPIRRYFDLVVHRMLIAAVNDEKARGSLPQSERPYSDVELAAIAHHCNYQAFNAKSFEKKTLALQYALRLREAPLTFTAFVSGISDTGLNLCFPYRNFLSSKSPLKLLKPISRPEISEDGIKMELQWKERVHEFHGSGTMPGQSGMTSHRQETRVIVRTLDTQQGVVNVSAEYWQEILQGVQAQDVNMIKKVVMDAESEQRPTSKQEKRQGKQRRDNNIIEVSCETSDTNKPLPFVNFKRKFERGDVVQIQLNASIQMGVLMPSHQLFCLTPMLSLCTEHRANAIESFAKVAAHRPPTKIKSFSKYKAVWLPILKMLSAYDAVLSDETSVLHGVDIKWTYIDEEDDQPLRISGTFELKKMFCHNRAIKIHVGDYLCIRYKDMPLAPNTRHSLRELGNTLTPSRSFTGDVGRYTFVAHAIITDIEDIHMWSDDWKMIIQTVVNQHSAPFPDVLLESKRTPSCTFEIIQRSQSDTRLESAVMCLNEADPLIKDICFHTKPKIDANDIITRILHQVAGQIKSFAIRGSPFASPNEPQETALRLALQQQFTIIQGPPGTGKTITGAHLTYFFTEVNKQLPDSGRGPPQVLYCGPSNKSVDVVAHYLLKLRIPVVRVYNTLVEQQDYPIPGHSGGSTSKIGNSQEAKMDPDLQHISLHHLIRQKSNSYSKLILDYDRRFQTPKYWISFEELRKYRKTIQIAEAEELVKYRVVLCTCNEAGSKCIQIYVNTIQCIVDEAGMCSEPETLIPLVGTYKDANMKNTKARQDPRQVVLIGDHKQLRPIIQERTAVQLGMEISLLEKYEEKATMLTIQYRMHESICAFPSEAFYKGKLVTADSVKKRRPPSLQKIWPGGRDNPLVFCHHVGVEEVQSVRTEEGNEQSRANPMEVQHVVRIASVVVNRLGVKQDNLVILTQYRLQRALIAEKLKEVGLEKITVSTVITSQGREWDYVILSTVRSLPRVEIDEKPSRSWRKRNLGFICDENQMNVAITRPRLGLIILGNMYLLNVHNTWRRLLAHYRDKNAVVNAEKFPKT